LTWFQSSTIAFFPDETHQTIRRTFSPSLYGTGVGTGDDDDSSSGESSLRHQFCGYCGTPLARWDCSSREAERFVALTLGSLLDEDLGRLDELGLLGDSDTDVDADADADTDAQPPSSVGAEKEQQLRLREEGLRVGSSWVRQRGAPWFEGLVHDSPLGRLRRRKGGLESDDGMVSVEWDVVEWTGLDEEVGGAKRKLEHVAGGQEDEMES
jgi:hypothetical protein